MLLIQYIFKVLIHFMADFEIYFFRSAVEHTDHEQWLTTDAVYFLLPSVCCQEMTLRCINYACCCTNEFLTYRLSISLKRTIRHMKISKQRAHMKSVVMTSRQTMLPLTVTAHPLRLLALVNVNIN